MDDVGLSPESPFSTYLDETRARFAARGGSWLSRHPSAPDPEAKNVQSKRLVETDGIVVWGLFVRAFWPCYMPGRNNHYGSVIVSFDPACEDPKLLFETAVKLRALRQPTSVPPYLAQFVAILRNDHESPTRILIPTELTEGREVYFQSILMQRNRLPALYLHNRLVPVIAHHASDYATILPPAFWSPELAAQWQRGEPPLPAAQLAAYRKGYPQIRP